MVPLSEAESEFVGKLVGTEEVIGLGEMTHGSRESVQSRYRLLRHLVNEHGVMGIVLNTDLSLTLKLNAFVLAGEGDAETLSMPRDFPLIRFNEIPWTSVAQGAREKRVVCGNYTLRLVEFAPPFIEVDWCHKQHLGFVVSGVFRVQFVDTLVSFKEGDGIAIVAGEATKHRAVVDQTVTLFLVEPTT